MGSVLPPDNHVHTQFSWDAPAAASMARSCEQALAVGVGCVAFTDHLDFTDWTDGDRIAEEHLDPRRYSAMRLLDVTGYLAAIEDCRERYPDLRILSGAEIGEAHMFGASAAALVARAGFDRVLGSLHAIPFDGRLTAADQLFGVMPAAEVMRRYFAEVVRLVEGSDIFQVLAHLDFPRRSWPHNAGALRRDDVRGGVPGRTARPGGQRTGARGEHQEPAGLGRADAVVAGRGRAGRLVRERRAPALAGRRQVQAGGRCGGGGRLPRRARSVRLLAGLAAPLAGVNGGTDA